MWQLDHKAWSLIGKNKPPAVVLLSERLMDVINPLSM
jgi:hypothetical protein